jgi:hypothetical protein
MLLALPSDQYLSIKQARWHKLFYYSQDYISKPGPLLILTAPSGCRVAGIKFPYYEPRSGYFSSLVYLPANRSVGGTLIANFSV